MAKLNTQFIIELNTVLQEVGLNPIENDGAKEALTNIVTRFVNAINPPETVEKPAPQPTTETKRPKAKVRRTKSTATSSTGQKTPYEYWNERIKAETKDLSSEEYEALKRHLAENNAFYSRNSTEKQLKRTFAIIKSWKEQNAGSQIDDSPF